ncbi:MAG: anthranilate synthase component I [bacterium]|jgi:anthranilate synthase component 1|nr:anthranilate synthase component I [bacterium]MDD3805257.1 anthranilate synthase component I [bacterium]MDD4153412.1 anthranilate synthase component I [bacterium]MDD4557496.1 anthranilate synthase component I [bacterium]
MYTPDLATFIKLSGCSNLVPVCHEILADLETPVSAYMKIAGGEEHSFLLESVEGGEKPARYSFLGASPFLIFRCDGREITIIDRGKQAQRRLKSNEEPLAILREILDRYSFAADGNLPPFCGGAVGYIGYDAVRHFECLPQSPIDDLKLPELYFILADTILIFDHLKHRIKIISNALIEGDPRAAYAAACARIEATADKLRRSLPERAVVPVKEAPVISAFGREDFCRAVEDIKEQIAAGEVIQAVLSHRMTTSSQAEPLDVYRALRSLNPSPYMYYLSFNDLKLIGSSPEILVTEAAGEVTTRPIAGTRRRGADAVEDERLSKKLLADEKERAEHIMLVELGCDDLKCICLPGTVKISEFMTVEKYSHVIHIVSNIQGKLQPGLDRFDALRACFPAGTVSGAPRIRAMEIISRLEPHARGPYAGAIGYFSFSGAMDTCITIRTIIRENGRYHIQAGAGIVADSRPEHEYQETLNKAMALLEAVRMAEKGLKNLLEIGGSEQ